MAYNKIIWCPRKVSNKKVRDQNKQKKGNLKETETMGSEENIFLKNINILREDSNRKAVASVK